MECRLFAEGTVPDYTTPEFYAGRDSAPHLEQDAHRGRLLLTAEMVRDARVRHGVNSVIDLGCGDGGLLSLIQDEVPAWGYDLQQTNVDASVARAADVRYGDVLTGDLEWGDLAVMTELIEHLVDPDQLLRRVGRHCEFIVASSPWSETEENHYAYHAWCWDQDGYVQLLERNGFTVLRSGIWSMFQVHLARKR